MGIAKKAGIAVWNVIKKAFRTVEHTTKTAVITIKEGAADTIPEFRAIGSDFILSLQRTDKKRAPKILFFIGLMSLAVASLYLLRLFDSIPSLRSDAPWWRTFLSLVLVGFMFGQYIFHVMAVFKLSSGSKKAWASMMRTSFSYIILMAITESSIMRYVPFDFITEYGSWGMLAVMFLVVILMFLGSVREYYTPAYAEQVSIAQWILYIVYVDPFKVRTESGKDTSESQSV